MWRSTASWHLNIHHSATMWICEWTRGAAARRIVLSFSSENVVARRRMATGAGMAPGNAENRGLVARIGTDWRVLAALGRSSVSRLASDSTDRSGGHSVVLGSRAGPAKAIMADCGARLWGWSCGGLSSGPVRSSVALRGVRSNGAVWGSSLPLAVLAEACRSMN